MALSSESNKQVFSPTAGQTSFQFTLKYFNSTDIKVEIKLANGNIVPASDFSFTVSAINNNEELGANVVITISPALAVGDVVTIFREVPYTQQYDLQPGSPINPTALNDAFDRIVAQNQQQNLNTQRTITFPVSDPSTTTYNVDSSTTQRANRALGFDSNGNITELNLSSTNTVAGNNNKGIDLVDSVIEAKVDSVTTTFDVNGNIIVKDSGITAAKLNTNSVTTAKILNDNVTYDKLQDISTFNSVLGSTGTGTVTERALVGDILYNDPTMAFNSSAKGATQSSIKAYVDSLVSGFATDGTGSGTRTSGGKIVTLGTGLNQIIIKTFIATSNIDNTESFTFPTAFPNNCFAVTYGGMSGSTTSLTASGFNFNRLDAFNGVFTTTCIAIGN